LQECYSLLLAETKKCTEETTEEIEVVIEETEEAN
jgi:hypothetical protein